MSGHGKQVTIKGRVFPDWYSQVGGALNHRWHPTPSGRFAIADCGTVSRIADLFSAAVLPMCNDCLLSAELRKTPGVERS